MHNGKFKKNSKKFKNIKKKPLWRYFKPKQVGKCREREKIKIIVSFRSYSMRNKEFHKKKKKLKNTITDSFQAKIGWKMMRKRENKNFRSVPFLPDA